MHILIAAMWLTPGCDACKDAREVDCGQCEGKFRSANVIAVCKVSQGLSCNGKGHYTCVNCRGAASVKCTNCGGDGKVRKKVMRSTGGMMKKATFTDENCQPCKATGKVDCTTCRPLWVSEGPPSNLFANNGDTLPAPPRISHSPPRPGDGSWNQFTGHVVCKRCDGKGTIQTRGLCAACTKGKVPCTSCVAPAENKPTVFAIDPDAGMRAPDADTPNSSREAMFKGQEAVRNETLIAEIRRLRDALTKAANELRGDARKSAYEALAATEDEIMDLLSEKP